MILAKLINPRVITDENGNKVYFENDLILIDDETGETVERVTLNLPYEIPDAEVEKMVKQRAFDKAVEKGKSQEKQGTVEWDWVDEKGGNSKGGRE
jgi:hypothetical protein